METATDPDLMSELIELLWNKEALLNSGARVIPLPPEGRLSVWHYRCSRCWNDLKHDEGCGKGVICKECQKRATS